MAYKVFVQKGSASLTCYENQNTRKKLKRLRKEKLLYILTGCGNCRFVQLS